MDSQAKLATALSKLLHEEHAARDFGFDYPNIEMLIDQVRDEASEVLEAIQGNESSERIQEEIGDLIHVAIAVCVFQGYDVDTTIDKAADKFAARMKSLRALASKEGYQTFKGISIDKMLQIWKQAKKQSK